MQPFLPLRCGLSVEKRRSDTKQMQGIGCCCFAKFLEELGTRNIGMISLFLREDMEMRTKKKKTTNCKLSKMEGGKVRGL